MYWWKEGKEERCGIEEKGKVERKKRDGDVKKGDRKGNKLEKERDGVVGRRKEKKHIKGKKVERKGTR